MKILAIISSTHMGNTRKIAEAMANAAPVTIAEIDDISKYHLHDYDIVGFGSGIYFGKHDAKIMEFVEKLCDKEAYSFVFSTSGSANFLKYNKPLVDLLESKHKVVLGSFGCKALDKFGPFQWIGGINKGHPDENDLKQAQAFIKEVIQKAERLKTQKNDWKEESREIGDGAF